MKYSFILFLGLLFSCTKWQPETHRCKSVTIYVDDYNESDSLLGTYVSLYYPSVCDSALARWESYYQGKQWFCGDSVYIVIK